MRQRLRLRLYIIAHDDHSMGIAERYAARFPEIMRAVRISTASTASHPHYMESAVFAQFKDDPDLRADWEREDIGFVGLLKYNFEEKMPFYDFQRLCQTEAADWDIWTFVNGHEDDYRLPNPSMITYAGICHTLFPVLWFLLFYPSVPLEKLFSPEIPAFYSNAWIVKAPYFRSLVLEWMPFAFARLEEEPLKTLCYYNANYLQRLPADHLTAIMKVPYYTYHCFLLERIPCLAFWALGGRWRPVGGPARRAATDPEPGLVLERELK